MSDGEREELAELRREMNLSSLGDKPYSIAANKLRRLIQLETQESDDSIKPFCWVCRSRHRLIASECRAMDSIA